jgi:vacuolar-type H+-ATPase subunit H
MNTLLSIELIAGVLVGLVIATVIMLVLQVRNSLLINKLTFPAYEYVVKQAEHKSQEILLGAQKEARGIIAAAEISGQNVFKEYSELSKKANESYLGNLETLVKGLEEKLSATAQKGDTHIEKVTSDAVTTFLQQQQSVHDKFAHSFLSLEETVTTIQTQTNNSLVSMRKRVDDVSVTFADAIAKQDASIMERIDAHMVQALEKTEEQVVAYEKGRITLIDTHIERLVEDITAQVLHKTLSLDEHGALARQALTDARTAHLL